MKKRLFTIIILVLIVASILFLITAAPIKKYGLFEWIACRFKGGNWGRSNMGIASSIGCFKRYPDGGKLCISSDECEGDCMISPRSSFPANVGKCEFDDRPKCAPTMENQSVVCIP